jgi:hypothetical protein
MQENNATDQEKERSRKEEDKHNNYSPGLHCGTNCSFSSNCSGAGMGIGLFEDLYSGSYKLVGEKGYNGTPTLRGWA